MHDPGRHHDGTAILAFAWRIDRRRKVFNWPGLAITGRLRRHARDYPVIQGRKCCFLWNLFYQLSGGCPLAPPLIRLSGISKDAIV